MTNTTKAPSAAGSRVEELVREYFSALGTPVVLETLPTRMSGGASRETWAVDVVFEGRDNGPVPLVYRGQFGEQELAASLADEHSAMAALHRAGQPIPRPYPAANSSEDVSFIVMDRAAGADLRKSMPTIAEPDRELVRTQLISILLGIHQVNPVTVFPEAGTYQSAIQSQLDQWVLPVLADEAAGEVPLLRAAARWLDAFRPTDGPLAMLHGDFKANNILVWDSKVTAVLDWELCHVGDPLEDLAWTLLWTTRWDIIGGLFDRQQFLEGYSAASGTEIDDARFLYWQLFSWAKIATILRRQGQEARKAEPSPMLAQLGRSVAYCETQIADLLKTMEARS